MIDKREIAPEFLTRVTALAFTKVSLEGVLKNVTSESSKCPEGICFDGLTDQELADLMMEDAYFRQSYSRLECVSYAQGVIEYVNKATQWHNRSVSASVEKVNVFDLLLVTLDDLLLVNHRNVECAYEYILSWRMLYQAIGEELPVSAKQAIWDYSRRPHFDRNGFVPDKQFDWPYMIPHNNKPLNRIMQRGIADHHNHLWGSAPYFHISWVNLMNRLTNSTYHQNLEKLPLVQQENTSEHIHYGEILQMRAAWIRWYLCRKLFPVDIEGSGKQTADYCHELRIVCDCRDWCSLILLRDSLQARINAYSANPAEEPDYILNLFPRNVSGEKEDYRILAGERGLYYYVFLDYCRPPQERSLSRTDFALFYAYCLIRIQIREQLVQINDRMGFDNFQSIERRKWYFTDDSESMRYLSRLAVNQVLNNPNIKELELRISPHPADLIQLEKYIHQDTEQAVSLDRRFFSDGSESVRYLHRLTVDQILRGAKISEPVLCMSSNSDGLVQLLSHIYQSANSPESLDNRYYYVFHFIKRPDMRQSADIPAYLSLRCRMEPLRNVLLQQALGIIDFRKKNPEMAHKLKGIDAAAQEIECRPEVFARAYRLLGDYSITYDRYGDGQQQLPELGKTYHVGEDFLDIIDGLRAIDEAIHFLNLDCGDRIGHAIVLGTDVEKWYETKHRRISLSVQDYLDNLAWFCHALNRLSVPNHHELQEWLNREFEYWFRIVYRNNISDEEMKDIMNRAKVYYTKHGNEDHGLYQIHHAHFDIQSYYRSWTLRGDDPVCYKKGYYQKPSVVDELIPEEAYKDNLAFPTRYDDRYIPEYGMLNYYYQFDADVRQAGQRRISVEVPISYIVAAKALQAEMRSRIARRGISIEANPSSNVLISTFRKYENHPLLAFFNRGLPVTAEEDANCTQLSVSINTDDSGVFCTNLEMEYAFMVRSLEMVEDSNGKPRFTTNDIYTWIDHIRQMGLDQSFNFKDA